MRNSSAYKGIGLLCTVLLLLLPVRGFTQVRFSEVSTASEMQEFERLASVQGKMLFVDVYAKWCAPCKMMDREVYTDSLLASYMNAYFINVRMDGETDYGRVYAEENKLQGYPSVFVFSSSGDPISSIVGYTDAPELKNRLESAAANYRKIRAYEEAKEARGLSNKDFAAYLAAVREMGRDEEAEVLASEYMEQLIEGTELNDEDIMVVAFYMDLEDEWWPAFASDRDRLQRVLGSDYMLALEKIYNHSLVKAVEQNDVSLVSRMANELGPMIEAGETSVWDLKSLPFLQYYYYTDKPAELISYVDARFASDRKGDHQWLYRAASQITDMDQQYMTPELLENEERWFRTCYELEPQFDYFFYHGMVLYILERKDEAGVSFKAAEDLAVTAEQKQMIAQVMSMVNLPQSE